MFLFCGIATNAQITCDPGGNLVIFSNYSGGVLFINVDVNIPNLKIGVSSHEAVSIHLTGAYAGNVTSVMYAGFNGANSTACGGSIPTTSISGAPSTATLGINNSPASPLTNPNGNPFIVCGQSCSTTTNQIGCNTIDQIESYFLTQFPGSVVRMHKAQYGCWSGSVQTISGGGTCCLTVAPTPLSIQFTPVQPTCFAGCDGSVTVNVSGGTPPYSFQWLGGPASSGWSGLCAGSYTVTVTDVNSVTATGTVTLLQPPVKTSSITQTACKSYIFNSSIITTSGSYTDTVAAVNGCDSIINLHLTINNPDVSVFQFINTLVSATSGATYQWINCDSASLITGEISQQFTPAKTGSYAVIVTKNGCTDTSDCNSVVVLNVDEFYKSGFRVYPNPTVDELVIEVSEKFVGQKFRIVDGNGSRIVSGVLSKGRNIVAMKAYAPGLYFIQLEGVNHAIKFQKYE